MNVDKIKAEALQLSFKERAHLARELLTSLETMSENEIETLWLDEAIRRDKELDLKTVSANPADEVLNRIREQRK